jgi:hypothetical protein
MQEHIRRAHPDYYIPKLPATEESFQLMITTPPTARPPPQQQPAAVPPRRGPCTYIEVTSTILLLRLDIANASDHDPLLGDLDGMGGHIPFTGPPGSSGAAVALSQMNQWDTDFVSYG